jgi:hypothetical protein
MVGPFFAFKTRAIIQPSFPIGSRKYSSPRLWGWMASRNFLDDDSLSFRMRLSPAGLDGVQNSEPWRGG